MARPSPRLISALRETADRVENGAHYEWGHMAHCNCGHLVQTLSGVGASQLSRRLDGHLDEWTEHANDYCGHTGRPVEELFELLSDAGLSRGDVIRLENLSDRAVLARIGERVYLRRNQRGDLVRYLRAFADLLEDELQRPAGQFAALSVAGASI